MKIFTIARKERFVVVPMTNLRYFRFNRLTLIDLSGLRHQKTAVIPETN